MVNADNHKELLQDDIKMENHPGDIPQEAVVSVQSNPSESTEGIASHFDAGLKTVVLWIYNINQNGTANTFREEMSQFFTRNENGTVVLKDMTPEMLAEFFANLTTAKEIKIPDLGIRLILLIYNCNQNGSSNIAEVAYMSQP